MNINTPNSSNLSFSHTNMTFSDTLTKLLFYSKKMEKALYFFVILLWLHANMPFQTKSIIFAEQD